jgi:apolipoprotein N-acyltransferase
MCKALKKALQEYWRTHKLMLIPFGLCTALVAAPWLARWGVYVPPFADAVDRTHMGAADPAYGPGATAFGIVSMWLGIVIGALIVVHAVYEVCLSLYYARQARLNAKAQREADYRRNARRITHGW